MSGHSKGPWTRYDTADYAKIVGPDGVAVALVGKEEDADVIAAAPDLLLAAKEAAVVLSQIAKEHGADPMKGSCLPRLMAAIAKATAQGMEARRVETSEAQAPSQSDESPVGNADAPNPSDPTGPAEKGTP
jgi:hypothetical protein